MKIENEFYRVRIDRRGAVCGLFDKPAGLELIAEPRLAESWRLLLPIPRPGMNPRVNYLLSAEQSAPAVAKTPGGLQLSWKGPLRSAQGRWDVAMTAWIEFRGAALEMRVAVENHSALTLAEVWVGGLGGLMGLGARRETETLVPGYNAANVASLFRHFPETMAVGGGGGLRFPEYCVSYPDMSMAWLSMYNPRLRRGVYYACHDVIPRLKVFRAELHPTLARLRAEGNWPTDQEIDAQRRAYPPGLVLHWVHLPFLAPGKTFESAPVVVQGHAGDWHAAAKLYRAWFASNFPLRNPAKNWLRQEQAVQDTMFMLPEGNVLNTFRDIPALARGAARYGVKTIMLSGWWRGGHDNQYPDYSPEPRLGSWADLRRGIAACHKLGVRVLFFANIDSVDISTARYRRSLKKYQVIKGNGAIWIAGWGMGTLSGRLGLTQPPISSCDAAFPAYRRMIVSQMRRLAEIGADGVHFDKVCAAAMDFNPRLEVSPDRAMFEGTLRCLEETLAVCRRVAPHFSISVESSWDRLLSYTDACWDWIDNWDHVSPAKYAFPEWSPAFTVAMGRDYNAVNAALRYGYHLLAGPIRYTASLDDPQMRALGRYIREALRIRQLLRRTIFLGEFLDTLEAEVEPRAQLRYNTHRDPATGRRACVLANHGLAPLTTTMRFQGPGGGRALVYQPFRKAERKKMPVTVRIPGERFAVGIEE